MYVVDDDSSDDGILTVRVAGVLGSLLGGDSDGLELVDAVEDNTGGDEERPHGLDDGGGVSAEAEESHRELYCIGDTWCGTMEVRRWRFRYFEIGMVSALLPRNASQREREREENARIQSVLLAPENPRRFRVELNSEEIPFDLVQ